MRRMILAVLLGASAAHAQPLDPKVARDAITIQRKMQCSATDLKPAVYQWAGKVYSRVEGERDRHLFNVEGMNIRQCGAVADDPQRGKGYAYVSREIMLYLDPKTGEVLRRWENPWSRDTVDVVHVANDPVNARGPTYERGADGKPYSLDLRVENGRVFNAVEVPLFYQNPLGGDYQESVGNQYHAMEIFDMVDVAQRLFDRKQPDSYPAVSWVRIAPWLPWMKMGSRPGIMVFNAVGQKLRSFDQLPAVMKQEIATNYPAYTAPPPIDDKRPNETSWTYYRKRMEAAKAQDRPDKP